MKITFQTASEESSQRMDAALVNIDLDITSRSLVLEFDSTTYDNQEVADTIERHRGRGVQNMKVEVDDRKYLMVVEPKGIPYVDTDDRFHLRYEIIAHTRD